MCSWLARLRPGAHNSCCLKKAHTGPLWCRAAFRTVSQLQRVHADSPQALFYHESLAPVVDACARSTTRLDEAFFLLEDMHLQVWGAAALGCYTLWSCSDCRSLNEEHLSKGLSKRSWMPCQMRD